MTKMSKNKMRELEQVRQSVYNCTKCGVCALKVTGSLPYVCPVRESSAGFEHYSSRGKTVIAQGLLEGTLVPSAELAEVLFSCTLCGNCTTQCGAIDQETGAPLVDTVRIVEALRADLLRDHPEWIERAYHTVLKATRHYGNPWGRPRAVKQRWTKGLGLPDAQKTKAEVLLFSGCTIPSHPALMGLAQKAAGVLQQAGVDVAVLGKDEPCCGSVQRRIGDAGLVREMMAENIGLLNGLGCKTVVTLCAGCCSMLRNEYSGADTALQPAVTHIVEFIARLIRQGKLNFSEGRSLRAAYHDPCHLGRQLGVFDPPREILKALPAIELVEQTATRENTLCCGAGGGMRLFADGALTARIGQAAVQAARDAGAEVLVSACPFCEMNLAAAASRLDPPLPVYDIIDVVDERLRR